MNAGGQGRPFLHALSRDFNFQRLGNLSRLLRLPRGEQIGFLRRGYEQKRRLRGIKAEVNPAIHAREIAVSYTHLDVYKRQTGSLLRAIL